MSEKSILDRLTVAVTESSDMEELVRPFLEILEEVTGLESTYLTRIDKDKGRQYIVFSHNTKTHQLNIPEGLSVDWSDTLCKRALDEEKPFYIAKMKIGRKLILFYSNWPLKSYKIMYATFTFMQVF